MKKKNIYFAMLLCLILVLAIFLMDYFRFVSSYPPSESEASAGGDEKLFVESGEKAPVIVEDASGRAKICVFGDNLIHENVLNEANRSNGGTGTREGFSMGFDFKPIYKNVASIIEEADFSICNQASLVGANDAPNSLSGYPLFNTPSSLGKDLVTLGFDGVNIANNHLLDMGASGLKQSIAWLHYIKKV